MGNDWGEQLGKRLSFLDCGATEEEEDDKEREGGGGGYIPTSTNGYLICESDKFVMSKHWLKHIADVSVE